MVMRVRYVLVPLVLVSSLIMASSLAGAGVSHAAQRPFNPVPEGWPKLLDIPRIGVRAPIEDVAMKTTNDQHAPYKWGDVAWYDRGPRPGDIGRSAIFGHLDSYCCPAVFYHLKDLHKGDVIQVAYKSGRTVTFSVQWVASYPNSALPMKFLFGPAKARTLVLWTCAGVFHTDGTGYDHKLVAFAQMNWPGHK